MRKLTSRQMATAAECLGQAFSHLRVADKLIGTHEYAHAVPKLYYAAFFAAKAATVEKGAASNRHQYWIDLFCREFGRGKSWVPPTYCRLLRTLSDQRNAVDYRGTLPNSAEVAKAHRKRVGFLLERVKKNTPLQYFPEFIGDLIKRHPSILAVEFDYYCPLSYLHKERVQLQVQAKKYKPGTVRRVATAGRAAIRAIGAARQEEYVAGWNNRLGQSGRSYLLFLDIDELDEGRVKAALKSRRGYLFKTGSGYHFVGVEIYPSYKAWHHRFQQAVKSRALSKLVDVRHYKFSLERGYATLRVTASPTKDFVPFVCWDNTR